MDITVLIKHIVDPKLITSAILHINNLNAVCAQETLRIIDPASETALEMALSLKDKLGCKVTALCAGYKLDKTLLKKSIAMGADELVTIDDPLLDNADAGVITNVLARFLELNKGCKLILCGRKSADWGLEALAASLSETLTLPLVTAARSISLNDAKCNVLHETDEGFEEVELTLPAIVSVNYEVGKARRPGLKGIMQARKAAPKEMELRTLGLSGSDTKNKSKITSLSMLNNKNVECEFINGAHIEEMADTLLSKLKRDNLI